MLLNVNKLTKTKLDSDITTVANEVEHFMARWRRMSDRINELTEAELTELGYDANTQAYIGSFRVALLNIEQMYRNQAKTGTDDPSYFVGIMSQPLAF